MIIKGKEIELTFKARQMIEVSEKVGNSYELELGAYKEDLAKLGKLISIFGSLDYNASLDLIDELLEAGATVNEIYTALFEEINKKGFFAKTPLTVGESMPVDQEQIQKDMLAKAQAQMSEEYLAQMMQDGVSQNMSKASRK